MYLKIPILFFLIPWAPQVCSDCIMLSWWSFIKKWPLHYIMSCNIPNLILGLTRPNQDGWQVWDFQRETPTDCQEYGVSGSLLIAIQFLHNQSKINQVKLVLGVGWYHQDCPMSQIWAWSQGAIVERRVSGLGASGSCLCFLQMVWFYWSVRSLSPFTAECEAAEKRVSSSKSESRF